MNNFLGLPSLNCPKIMDAPWFNMEIVRFLLDENYCLDTHRFIRVWSANPQNSGVISYNDLYVIKIT